MNKTGKGNPNGTVVMTVTALVFAILVTFVGYTIQAVDSKVSQSCFDNLAKASQDVGRDLQRAADTDRAVLCALGTIIAGETDQSDENLRRILCSYDLSSSYLSYVELLRPDNTFLDSDGAVRDVSAFLDFGKEAAKGTCISGIETSTLDSQEKVLRNSVPVVKDGKTVAILYGVIRLSDLKKMFHVNLYNGQAYLFLEDGDTGDFILDTWHSSLKNINDFSDRKVLSGYSWDNVLTDTQLGRSGRISFVSNTINEVVLLHYAPSGINNFNVMVMTLQRAAMAESRAIRAQLYLMAGVIGAVTLLYMAFVTLFLFRAYRQVKKLSTEDQSTGLLNRNAYESYVFGCREQLFADITCVYVDVNGLHEVNNRYGHAAGDQMLRTVADALNSCFAGSLVYRAGGDEFVVLCENTPPEHCRAVMVDVQEKLAAHDYSISFGIANYQNEIGVERTIKKADELMLRQKTEYYEQHSRRERRQGGSL